MYHQVTISQADDTWGKSQIDFAHQQKTRRRMKARRQREKFRAELREASAAKRSAGLTQRVAHDRVNHKVHIEAEAPAEIETVNGVRVVVRTKSVAQGGGWITTRISLPYVSILEAG